MFRLQRNSFVKSEQGNALETLYNLKSFGSLFMCNFDLYVKIESTGPGRIIFKECLIYFQVFLVYLNSHNN